MLATKLKLSSNEHSSIRVNASASFHGEYGPVHFRKIWETALNYLQISYTQKKATAKQK